MASLVSPHASAQAAHAHGGSGQQRSPPVLMGVVYREGTLYPTHKKLGYNIVLFNRTTGIVAPIDQNGCVRLEAGGDYIPERSDSDRLRKSTKWSKTSGSLTNLTLRSRRSSVNNAIGKSLSRLASAFSSNGGVHPAAVDSTGSNPCVQFGPDSPEPSSSYTTAPPPSAATDDGSARPGSATASASFFGTIRGRRRSAEVVTGMGSSANALAATATPPGMNRSRSRSRTGSAAGGSILAGSVRSASVQDLGPRASRPSISSTTFSGPPVGDADREVSHSAASSINGKEPAGSSAEAADNDEELTLEDFLRKDFKSTPSILNPVELASSSNPAIAPSAAAPAHALGPRSLSPVMPISEEPAGSEHHQETVVVGSEVTLCASLIMVRDGRPGTVWVNLQSGHVHIYSDPHMNDLVDSLQVAENCMAMPDTRNADQGAFYILQDDVCISFIARSRDDMLNWVSSVNSASLPDTSSSARDDRSSTDNSSAEFECDYRKEYEEMVKSFDLVELSRIKLPETATRRPISVDRLNQLRQNRMSVLRQININELAFDSSAMANPHLHLVATGVAKHPAPPALVIPEALDELSPPGACGDMSGLTPSPISQTPSGSNLPELGAPAAAASPAAVSDDAASMAIQEEFQADRINQQMVSPDRDVSQMQATIQQIGNSPVSSLQRRTRSDASSSPRPSPLGASDEPESACQSAISMEREVESIDEESSGAGQSVNTPSPRLPGTLEAAGGATLRGTSSSEETLMKHGAATLDKLVERLADEHGWDPQYVDTFLIGYRHFTDTATVLEKLLARLHCVAPANATAAERVFVAQWRPIIRLRVIAVVKMWVERYWVDFVLYSGAREQLDEICDSLERFEPEPDENAVAGREQRAFFSRLSKLLRKLVVYQSNKATAAAMARAVAVSVESGSEHRVVPPCDFLAMDPIHIAVQLTALEFKRFKAVRPIECVLNLWADTKDPAVERELRNMADMVAAFNQVSYWVATEVCTQPELPTRIKTVERMIKIAKICRRERNFNTTVAIVAGLNNSAVLRLKQTWEGIQEKYRQTFQDLEDLVSQTHNFKNYRHALDTMAHEGFRQPFIPFFGLFVKDLMFWNENPKLTESGLINFSKVQSIAGLIQAFRRWQDHEYAPSPATLAAMGGSSGTGSSGVGAIPELVEQYCRNLRALKEPAIYKYSCLCERKGGANGSTRLIDKWAQENAKR
ncbi:hypothetical protein H9P43_010086 [Blastocladiella emersonii ATCC 22665]|nr:hypothetical protein H9P43_010086 [Blastocladiella emersonii ATCC 22665]